MTKIVLGHFNPYNEEEIVQFRQLIKLRDTIGFRYLMKLYLDLASKYPKDEFDKIVATKINNREISEYFFIKSGTEFLGYIFILRDSENLINSESKEIVTPELMYFIKQDSRNNHVATNALKVISEYLLQVRNYPLIYLNISLNNKPSMKVAKNNNFEFINGLFYKTTNPNLLPEKLDREMFKKTEAEYAALKITNYDNISSFELEDSLLPKDDKHKTIGG